jgi:hypothetical protein
MQDSIAAEVRFFLSEITGESRNNLPQGLNRPSITVTHSPSSLLFANCDGYTRWPSANSS